MTMKTIETFEFSKKSDFLNKINAPIGVDIPEFTNAFRCTKEELDNLKKEISNKSSSETQGILDKFLQAKNSTIKSTTNNVAALREQMSATDKAKRDAEVEINRMLDNFSMKGLKEVLEYIDEKESIDKPYWTHFMVGRIQEAGYDIFIDGKNVSVMTKGKTAQHGRDVELILNNYIDSKRFDIEHFKTAILYRTSQIDNYVEDHTDKDGNLTSNKLNAKHYREYLLEKAGLDKTWFVTREDILRSKLTREDQLFLLSYESHAYDNKDIDQDVKQYKFTKQHTKVAIDSVPSHDQNGKPISPDWKKGANNENRSTNEIARDFMKDPFKEISNVMSKAGPVGGLAILIALIYGIWNNKKTAVGLIAAWGVAKGTGKLDEFADQFGVNDGKGKNDTKKDSSKKSPEAPILNTYQVEATNRVTTNGDLISRVKSISEKTDKKGKMEDYTNFINSPDFQKYNLKQLIYTDPRDNSIFSSTTKLDASVQVPENLSPLVLKLLLREYFGVSYKLSDAEKGKNIGDKEIAEFENKHLKGDKAKKEKKVSEMLALIYSKK